MKAVRDSLDKSWQAEQPGIEKRAEDLYKTNKQEAIKLLNEYSNRKAADMLSRWKQLAIYLIVKYNDMAVKPEKDGKFERTATGLGVPVKRPGYTDYMRHELIRQTGDRFKVPGKATATKKSPLICIADGRGFFCSPEWTSLFDNSGFLSPDWSFYLPTQEFLSISFVLIYGGPYTRC